MGTDKPSRLAQMWRNLPLYDDKPIHGVGAIVVLALFSEVAVNALERVSVTASIVAMAAFILIFGVLLARNIQRFSDNAKFD